MLEKRKKGYGGKDRIQKSFDIGITKLTNLPFLENNDSCMIRRHITSYRALS